MILVLKHIRMTVSNFTLWPYLAFFNTIGQTLRRLQEALIMSGDYGPFVDKLS